MRNRIFINVLLCFALLTIVTACTGEKKKEEKGKAPEFLVDQEWQHNTLSCAEILRFRGDGSFAYYEACGNPVGDSDCYETYSYDEENGVITVYGYDESMPNMEIAVLRYTKDSLLVSIDGDIKEFYTYDDVQALFGDMYDKLDGYSAYVAIGDVHDEMIETAPSNFDVDAGGLELIREEKLSEKAAFYCLYEEVRHAEGEEDKIVSEFTELNLEEIGRSEDNSFHCGYVWYNEQMEIVKIVYYGCMEIWE